MISFAVTFELGASVRTVLYGTAEGHRTPQHEFPLFSRSQSHRSMCWKSWKDSCLNTWSIPYIVSVLLEADYMIHKNRREISSSIPRQKQHCAQIPNGFLFPFHLGRKEWIYLVSCLPPPPIWCTFTVSKNEFCFQYICQIKTSGRKKNLHFKEPHVSSHFWHCRTQHKNTQTNQDSRYKLFHRIYILKGTSTNITKWTESLLKYLYLFNR